jgi:putative transposase
MPWKECIERLKFIARPLDGEKMAGLCREFGISRKTGYKIVTRYNEVGLEGLTDRSRRPYRHASQHRVRRAEGGHQTGERGNLAGHLHGL